MALIEAAHPALNGNDRQFWEDQLKNSRVLLFELDKAILALARQEIESYTINTGQDIQTVKRQNLPELIRQRDALLKQIQSIQTALETLSAAGNNFIQVVPY
jgi:hypothetical protein